jgi:hypothetical protein
MQRRERAERRHRMRLHAHRAAARYIKHPKRQLPKAYRRRLRKAASRRGDRPTLDYLMNANSASHPGMPRVDDLDLVASFRTVCLLVRTCTIPHAAIRRSTSSARFSSKGGQRKIENALHKCRQNHVAVALANKMARIAFAILRSKTVYREIPA